MTLSEKVNNYIHEQQLLSPHEKLILGVSGGADSVVMLDVMLKLGYGCVVAHCNFQLRGADAHADTLFVEQLAKERNCIFEKIEFDTTHFAHQNKISIEMAARQLRYEWFETLRQKYDAQAIAVAHHADDSIETMLMNMVRGTGIKGLTGIKPKNNYIVRPLLCSTRQQIEHYLSANDLPHVEDSTNAESKYTRNKFRNEVLPLLEQINPSARQALYDTIEHICEAEKIYQKSISKALKKCVQTTKFGTVINIGELMSFESPNSLLFEALSPIGFSPDVIREVNSSLNGQSGKQFWSKSHRLVKDRERLIITPIQIENEELIEILDWNFETQLPIRIKFTKSVRTEDFILSKSPNFVQLDAARLQLPFTLRKWNEGDYFYPLGMNKRKKLSDFFIDNKLSIIEKENIWLLTSRGEIVWIVGYRIDDRFKITASTSEVLEIRID